MSLISKSKLRDFPVSDTEGTLHQFMVFQGISHDPFQKDVEEGGLDLDLEYSVGMIVRLQLLFNTSLLVLCCHLT